MPLEFRVLKDCEEAESLSAAVTFVAQIAMVLVHVENSSRCCLGLDLSSFEEFEE